MKGFNILLIDKKCLFQNSMPFFVIIFSYLDKNTIHPAKSVFFFIFRKSQSNNLNNKYSG